MNRPWQVWLIFAACVVGATVAMSWLTRQAIHSDAERRIAQSEADLEQRASLALWRIDTALAPIIAAEIVRPVSAYRLTRGARQESQQHEQAAQPPQQQSVEQIQPMPQDRATLPDIIVEPPPYVLLQFEALADGSWHSPQVSPNAIRLPGAPATMIMQRGLLEKLARSVEWSRLLAMVPKTSLPSTPPALSDESLFGVDDSTQSGEDLFANAADDPFGFVEGNRIPETAPSAKSTAQVEKLASKVAAPSKAKLSKTADFALRNERLQQAAQQNFMMQQQRVAPRQSSESEPGEFPSAPIGVSRPVWLDGRLLLARRVFDDGLVAVQGAWLDWDKIRTDMLHEVADLLPGADLVPVDTSSGSDPGRMLAGLPVRLVVAPAMAEGAISPTLRWALWLGWGALALTALSAAVLLHGVMRLSERRAAFVSSVTHELRTPLTTFRMYSEMLARGMVPDAERRQEYLHTLEREGERLTLLVENVLAYARLERGRRPRATEQITIAKLLDRLEPRLRKRAAEAKMELVRELAPAVGAVEVFTDTNVVDQIFFNLVDNAAKYAWTATNRQIHITGRRGGRWLALAVSDHGPGITTRRWSQRFRAFGKSAEESAETAPGVGLGLALCQRLARQLNGRLEIDDTPGGGATVSLLLPVA